MSYSNISPLKIPITVSLGTGQGASVNMGGRINQIRVSGPSGAVATLRIEDNVGLLLFERKLQSIDRFNEMVTIPVRGIYTCFITAATINGAYEFYLGVESL